MIIREPAPSNAIALQKSERVNSKPHLVPMLSHDLPRLYREGALGLRQPFGPNVTRSLAICLAKALFP